MVRLVAPLQDIQSGNCAVHNTCLVDFPQKGVLYAPWRIRPTPFWSPFARNAEALAPRAMAFMVRTRLHRQPLFDCVAVEGEPLCRLNMSMLCAISTVASCRVVRLTDHHLYVQASPSLMAMTPLSISALLC